MTELCVVVDRMVTPAPDAAGRYTGELTRALIAAAPEGASVTGFLPAVDEARRAAVEAELPGLGRLEVSRLDRRALALAWELGALARPVGRMLHAPTLFAPTGRHERTGSSGRQVAVTVHDTVPWTHPESLPRGTAAWQRRMTERATRYADAIVVTSHSVAAQLTELLPIDGDRIRVVPAGVTRALLAPDDDDARAGRLGLPERYVLSVGSIDPHTGLPALLSALALPALDGVPLVHAGRSGVDAALAGLAAEAGLDSSRVIDLGVIDDADLAVVLRRAAVFAMPNLADGLALPLLEALAAGVPTVHSDAPVLVELAAGAGIVIERDPAESYAVRLADALRGVWDDPAFADRLSTLGIDRAKAFSWRDSAEKVWQLHADL